jgi:hypothetical protein
MLLESNNIAIEGEHVVHTFIFKALDVDVFVLLELDELAHHVVFF